MSEFAELPERQRRFSEPAANMRWRAGILEQAWRVHWDNGEETYEWRLVPTVEAAVTDDNRHEEA